MDPLDRIDATFRARIASGDLPEVPPAAALDPVAARAIWQAQCLSRQIDREARAMQRRGEGFYTIGSAGHEGMAAVAHALRPTDMALLHYRDAAFQLFRSAQAGETDGARDILLGLAAASDDPVSGGRHKVLGSKRLAIPPQTSTIASHLPKAVGLAFSIGLARRARPEHRVLPDDAVVMASFGDASLNHSTAQGALNAAAWTAFRGGPLPLLLVCEDNGIGISVPTPEGWVAASLAHRPGLAYFAGDGCDMAGAARAAVAAAEHVRRTRRPAVLHLRVVRLGGHAGSDVEAAYRSPAETQADEARDPLLVSVRRLADIGAMTPAEALGAYDAAGETCARLAAEAAARPRLTTAADVARSLIPPPRRNRAANAPDPEARDLDTPQPMARLLGSALADILHAHPETVLMGEDVGRKGGVYGVTRGLLGRFGPARVIDTLLDEQTILGLAIGTAMNGFVPIPEIQFLAYLHNAEDQLRGEAATLPFFSNGQFANPMVLRIAGLGYQKGFGGHFHNDNSLAVLRDIPGLVIACPSNGADAAMMLRECVRLAREENRVCVFVEPIALYQARDGAVPGDWLRPYPAPDRRIPLGEIGIEGAGPDLAIVSYANGYFLAHQAAAILAAERIRTRLIDIRWLAPLPADAILAACGACAAVLVVDECRATGSQSEALMTLLAGRRAARVTATDSFIATGPASAATLPSRDGIVAAARKLAR